MDWLQSFIDQSEFPIWTAFLLGIMTAISPCPLATNITATAYIGRHLKEKRKIFIHGLIYTLGRAISYFSLGVILYFGASTFRIARFFQTYGERILGPLLIIAGVVMLDLITMRIPGFSGLGNKLFGKMKQMTWLSSLLLGVVFALAFCPYSGLLYFGMLIPLTIASPDGLILPLVYAFATGLPVILIAYLLAFTVGGVGQFYNKILVFEKWFRRIMAIIFIATGVYFVIIFFF